MTSAALLKELRLAQELVTALAESLDEDSQRRQFHPELSPLGWHLGHCTYTECYWLQEVVLSDHRHTAALQSLYTPALTAKADRGHLLPQLGEQLQWVSSMQAMNRELLASDVSAIREHPLMQQDYLLHFLVQHYNQHYETMLSALMQRAILDDDRAFRVQTPLAATPPDADAIALQAGHYKVGGSAPTAYDNELPAQQATLGPFSIARQPVRNAEYLAFMEAGGYQMQTLWSEAGWQWLSNNLTGHPHHWRQDESGHWYGVGVRGAYELDGDDVVHGLSYHEASAYAGWAGGQLPHEHQWEVACRLQHLEQTGRAWEWCQNAFYPYEGFQAFPYDGYSQPSFDRQHYTLRGGCVHTRPAIKRPSFRNFHTAGKRHIFAGLRLVY